MKSMLTQGCHALLPKNREGLFFQHTMLADAVAAGDDAAAASSSFASRAQAAGEADVVAATDDASRTPSAASFAPSLLSSAAASSSFAFATSSSPAATAGDDDAPAGDDDAAVGAAFCFRFPFLTVAFVPLAAAVAFVNLSSVPASRNFFCGCSIAADSNALVVAFVPPAAGVVVAAVDAAPSFATAGADANATGALGTPLLFPFRFLV